MSAAEKLAIRASDPPRLGLTDEQRAIRATGIGASEIAAVIGVSPYSTALDVWMRKPNPARAALIGEDDAGAEGEVGHVLEDGIRYLFERRTGKRVRCAPPVTLRHPSMAYVLASPDDLLLDEPAGLEIKVVGARMAHHWDGDVVPDYVATQVAQSMAVTGLSRWYVAALIAGPDLRIMKVERDAGLEDALLGAATRFWEGHVLTNEPPEAPDFEARGRYIAARYPRSKSRECRPATEAEGDVLARYAEARRVVELAEQQLDLFETDLCAAIGDDYGIETDAAKMLWIPKAGAVSWKAVAEELAGGAVPADVMEKHRGAPFRSPAFYPKKRQST